LYSQSRKFCLRFLLETENNIIIYNGLVSATISH